MLNKILPGEEGLVITHTRSSTQKLRKIMRRLFEDDNHIGIKKLRGFTIPSGKKLKSR